MPKDEKKASILGFFKIYGFNAIFGFGLGVGIVILSFTLLGRSQVGKNIRGEAQAPQIVDQASKEVKMAQQKTKSETTEEKFSSIYGEPLKNSRFTILLVGMDKRPEETSLGNTDSLLIASIDQTNERMTFLSIPRDTQVDLPGVGIQKINAIARLQKGFPAIEKYIESMIGFPIDGYVAANFNGFKNIIDSLGGITITVEKNMHYDTGDSQDRYIDLKKGTQRLNGSQALQYARFRNDELGDISRTVRQQTVVKAIFSEATELKNLPKIPFVIPKVYEAVQTDLSIGQLWSLASLLNKTQSYQTVSQTLPGRFAMEKGISYWKINSNQVQKVVSLLFLDGKTTSVLAQENRTSAQSVSANSSSPLEKTPTQSLSSSGKNQVKQKENSGDKQNRENQEIQFEVIEKGR